MSCIDCTDRRVGCHSHCERYRAFRAELDSRREKNKAEHTAAIPMTASREKMKRRMLRLGFTAR